jgi:hypothetical protein
MIRDLASSTRPAASLRARQRRSRAKKRGLHVERLESRQLMALLLSGTGEGHVQVLVNEYGAYGASPFLAVTTQQVPGGPAEIGDAIYDPVGALPAAGTTWESGLGIKVGGAATTFLTAGTIGGRGNFDNGLFATPLATNTLNSTFYYPNTAQSNGTGAVIRVDLTQTITSRTVSGNVPIGVTLQQTYRLTNLTGSPLDVQLFRYVDGDLLFDGAFANDGAGMRQTIVGNPEFVWQTNTATNTNKNDPSYMEIRSSATGIQRPNRWEVGLAAAVGNGPLLTKILAGGPLSDDNIPTVNDLDGNNKVDNARGNDWSVALRNLYTIAGGASQVYVTETQWGDPEIGDADPPVILPPQRGIVAGVVYSDLNSNGNQDAGEFGFGGFRVYGDLNNNGRYTAGEPYTYATSDGSYQLTLTVGTYNIREENPAGYTVTEPPSGSYAVTIATAGTIVSDIDFGNFATPGQVSGLVFNDFNNNARIDLGEAGLPGATVFADLNNNGILEASEPRVVTAADGTYTLANLTPGGYVLRQVPPAGYEQTYPIGNGAQVLTLFPGATVTTILFGDRLRDGQVSGKVYLESNGNNVIDPGEPGAAGVIVYLDRDNNCNIGLGENAIVTDARGTFGMLGIRPGTYTLRIAPPTGVDQILPAGGTINCGAGYTVVVQPGQTAIPGDFLVGNTGGPGTKDFGDAPAPYPTTLAQNGARATVARNFGLGAMIDTELDGQPTVTANGDDITLSPDEDGVVALDPLRPGQSANLRVVVQTGARAAGRLQGFIDFNGDGDWNDTGEKVFSNMLLGTGTYVLPVQVPAGAVIGRTFARFRYGYEQNLGPTGDSILGEVEDYAFFIVGPAPDAIDDTFNFTTLPGSTTLDVLANDTPSQNGPGIITSINTAGMNGTVTINPGGTSLQYTPTGNVAFEQFTYTIRNPIDPTQTDTATVRINIVVPPTAVDDTYLNVPFGATAFVLNPSVLNNDIPRVGLQSDLRIVNVSPRSQGGIVTISPDGRNLLYTSPTPTFSGTDTFSYTVRNLSGGTATANVTVVVNPPGAAANDLVGFNLTLLKLNNELLDDPADPNDDLLVAPGQMFKVLVQVDDLRTVSPNPPDDDRGVFGAYLDLLFDPTRLEVVPNADAVQYPLGFEIVFGAGYPARHTGTENTPGLVDQVGAIQNQAGMPLGSDPINLFIITLRVKSTAPDGPAYIRTDPAEVTEDAEVLLFEPPTLVPTDQIRLAETFIIIDASEPVDNNPASGPAGEAYVTFGGGSAPPTYGAGTASSPYRNAANPYDVNHDNRVSPLDALLVINALNASGPRSLTSDPLPVTLQTPAYRDVDGDSFMSPLDALLIITRLNAGGAGEATTEEVAAPSPTAWKQAVYASPQGVVETSTITLAPNESVTAPTYSGPLPSQSTSSIATLSDDDAPTLSFGSAAAFVAGSLNVGGSSSSTDFGAATASGADAEDDEFDILLDDLAQDACHQWRD